MVNVVLVSPGSRMAPAPLRSLWLWDRFSTLIPDDMTLCSHFQVNSANRTADLVRRSLNWEWQQRGQSSLRWGCGGLGGQEKGSRGVNSRDTITNKTGLKRGITSA